MNCKVLLALLCASFLVLGANIVIAQEHHDEKFAAEIVNTNVEEQPHDDDDKNDAVVENEDDEHVAGDKDDVPTDAAPDVEQIDHENNEDIASGETSDVETETAGVKPSSRSGPRATGRSGNYQYDEFLGGLDGYYPENNGYDYGE